jgi:ankyrin repeat protein
LSILKLLHENGANLNVADDGGTTAVHLAAAQAQTRIDLMKYLLDNGGDVHINAVDVRRDDVVMRYVIPDINWRIEEQRLLPDGKRKRTPVHYAAENEKTLTEPNYVLQLVLERGGNPNAEDERKRTPVHLAVLNGGLSGSEMLKVLLKHEGNPNAVDDQLMTPVHFAAKTQVTIDKVKRIKLLMKHGGDPNAVDSSGLTPVHYAAMNESNLAPKILDLLLEKNGNPNAVDPSGLTPLHCCLIKNPSARVAEKILELLMKHGGDPQAPDNEGKTPIDLLAAKGQSTEMQNMSNILKLNQRH